MAVRGGNILKNFNELQNNQITADQAQSKTMNLALRILVLVMVAGSLSTLAKAQLNSAVATVGLTATLAESLTVTATPANITFTLSKGGTSVGSSAIAIVTTWVLLPTRANVVLSGYFSSTTAALTDGMATPNNIPTSEVLGQVPTGTPTTYTAFTATTTGTQLGTTGATLVLYTQALSSTNRASTRTDNLTMEINLASQLQLPAGTYTGTLNLQAQAL